MSIVFLKTFCKFRLSCEYESAALIKVIQIRMTRLLRTQWLLTVIVAGSFLMSTNSAWLYFVLQPAKHACGCGQTSACCCQADRSCVNTNRPARQCGISAAPDVTPSIPLPASRALKEFLVTQSLIPVIAFTEHRQISSNAKSIYNINREPGTPPP
jgi:hypothetical protein